MQKKNNTAPVDGAQDPKNMPLLDSDEQTYPVNVDGQTIELTLEQLIQAAEQGLSKANATARRGQAAENTPNGNVYQAFLEEYPDIQPDAIPPEVWDNANRSGDLLGAYRAYEILKLREELEELKKNAENRKMDVGSARSDGENSITDPIILALMGKG
ncbi:MAG: hypothetical protein Q4C40_07115 [Eubacteriales bacterium]|nr:hypothetical protein [Eubacteriales bacterium]